MLQQLSEQSIHCPYCGECIHILVDDSEIGQDYIEDCQVCCRPIVLSISSAAGNELIVIARSENDTF